MKILFAFFETEDKVELNTLTLLGMDKISAYIALLFLSVNENYDLVQDEFYSDLYVVKRTQSSNLAEVV
ncbi:MAG: segregation/condensation protein A [Candidatus Melainabacteria bacterium]|nr:MAG: segregation/condensation protein A [Candidatus Melainabacteria bacterium]